MSILTNKSNFEYLKFLELNIVFNNFSLNSCNSLLKNFVYFNIASYLFIIIFSFSFILLGFTWSRSKEDIFLLWKFVFYRNLLSYYFYKQYSSKEISKIITKLLEIYKDLYELDLKEILNLNSHNAIFWCEPWSYEVLAVFPPFDIKFHNSPWSFYYKYRLSSWLRWHILEDRICIFVLFFLFILI